MTRADPRSGVIPCATHPTSLLLPLPTQCTSVSMLISCLIFCFTGIPPCTRSMVPCMQYNRGGTWERFGSRQKKSLLDLHFETQHMKNATTVRHDSSERCHERYQAWCAIMPNYQVQTQEMWILEESRLCSISFLLIVVLLLLLLSMFTVMDTKLSHIEMHDWSRPRSTITFPPSYYSGSAAHVEASKYSLGHDEIHKQIVIIVGLCKPDYLVYHSGCVEQTCWSWYTSPATRSTKNKRVVCLSHTSRPDFIHAWKINLPVQI